MAIGALDLQVGIFEFKIRVAVIKDLHVKQYDVCLTAYMIGMTISALSRANVLAFTMEALLRFDVCSDRFVAIETKFALRLLTEQFMTALAIAFELGVPLDHRPWHCQFGNIFHCRHNQSVNISHGRSRHQ